MNKHGIVKLNAFETTIKWFVGDLKEFIKKYKLEKCEIEGGCLGLTFIHNGVYYIYSDGTDDNNTIPHEVIHVVARMAEYRGMLFDGTNHEMIAHLVGYISGKILDKLNYGNTQIPQ